MATAYTKTEINEIIRDIRFEVYENRCLNPYWFQIESKTNWNNNIYQTKTILNNSLKESIK